MATPKHFIQTEECNKTQVLHTDADFFKNIQKKLLSTRYQYHFGRHGCCLSFPWRILPQHTCPGHFDVLFGSCLSLFSLSVCSSLPYFPGLYLLHLTKTKCCNKLIPVLPVYLTLRLKHSTPTEFIAHLTLTVFTMDSLKGSGDITKHLRCPPPCQSYQRKVAKEHCPGDKNPMDTAWNYK